MRKLQASKLFQSWWELGLGDHLIKRMREHQMDEGVKKSRPQQSSTGFYFSKGDLEGWMREWLDTL